MSGTLGGLPGLMTKISLRVQAGALRAQRQVALAVDQAVVMATPVDTGRARSNWLVSTVTPNLGIVPPPFPGVLGSTAGPNSQYAISQARATIMGSQPGVTIYISNNLPYIELLNQGSSKQAPANYVESATQAAAAAVKGITVI